MIELRSVGVESSVSKRGYSENTDKRFKSHKHVKTDALGAPGTSVVRAFMGMRHRQRLLRTCSIERIGLNVNDAPNS